MIAHKYSDGLETDIVLLVTTDTYIGSDYGHIRIRPAYLETDSDARLCNSELAGLQVVAQFNCSGVDAFSPYGTDVEYGERYSVSLNDAKTMAKMLAMIDRKMTRYNDDWGHLLDSDVGTFAVRFAKAIGATGIITSLDANKLSGYVSKSPVSDIPSLVRWAIDDAKDGKWSVQRRYS